MDESEENLHAYYASQAVYGSPEHHNLLKEAGYKQDTSLSSDYIRTYHRPGKAIVTYKGTNVLDPKDLKADVAIALGRQRSNQDFRKATEIAKKAKQKYQNIITTGHSLGGTKAIESANDTNAKAIVFNPGTGLAGLKTGKHKVYINEQDIIASRVKGSNITKVKGSRFRPLKSHSITTFEDTFRPRSQRYSHVSKKQKLK
jgi:dienelactone hydrolase